MFLLSPKTLLLFLMWACASSANRNASGRGRTLTIFYPMDTDQIDLPSNNFTDVNNSKSHYVTYTKQNISEGVLSGEAWSFLTGPLSTVLIPSFYTLVCLISMPFNICAVIVFAWRIQPKKPAAIYMLNLACADLLFALLLPFKISYHFGGNNWVFGPLMCRVVTAAFYWNMYCSVLLITCISVDRLLAIVYPIDSLVWRTPQNSIKACVTMWILSFAGSVPLLVSEQTVHLTQLDITTCHDIQGFDQQIGFSKIYFITFCCLLFFLPLLITVVSYSWVIWSLGRVPQGVPEHSRKRTRALVMVVTVLVMFVLCFMPTNCLLLAHYLQFNKKMTNPQEAPDSSYVIYLVFLCLGSLNCLLDPLVYYFGSSQCQKELSKVLRCQKITEISSNHSSSGSYKSTAKALLKSSRTESSKTNTSSQQASLNDQYKKLLV